MTSQNKWIIHLSLNRLTFNVKPNKSGQDPNLSVEFVWARFGGDYSLRNFFVLHKCVLHHSSHHNILVIIDITMWMNDVLYISLFKNV